MLRDFVQDGALQVTQLDGTTRRHGRDGTAPG